jgi:hypothetical protein
MTITYHDELAVFGDSVGADAAEELLNWAQKHPHGKADLSGCSHLHAAQLQVLMAARIPIASWPHEAGLTAWLTTALGS